MRLSDEELRDKTVIGADGHVIGEVSALFVDPSSWTIDALRVKLRREAADRLGAARSIFSAGSVEIPIRMVQSVGDAVVLSVAGDALRELVAPEGEEAAPVAGVS